MYCRWLSPLCTTPVFQPLDLCAPHVIGMRLATKTKTAVRMSMHVATLGAGAPRDCQRAWRDFMIAWLSLQTVCTACVVWLLQENVL